MKLAGVPLTLITAIIHLLCLPTSANEIDSAKQQHEYNVDDCIRVAIEANAQILQAETKVQQWLARLNEVESTYWPKLNAITYIAPMYTVRGNVDNYETRWRKLQDWGPYTHLKATLSLPLYSFGRVEAGAKAAASRAAVEQARVREARNAVILEVKRFYYNRLFALSMLPSLQSAADTVKEALEYANKVYAEGSGEVTQVDLAKLQYAQSQVEKYLLISENNISNATAALKHTMGIADHTEIIFTDKTLPAIPDDFKITLAQAVLIASKQRPEWAEIQQGKTAALALAQAEKLANAPTLFTAGEFSYDWAPTRDDSTNPYLSDRYNDIFAGVAVGFKFDLDPALSKAKEQNAQALVSETEALDRFAKTGIPLQVKKAHNDTMHYGALDIVAKQGVKATKRWLTFSASAYTTGLGEARNVIEGLASYLQARRDYLENVQNYFIARAELDYAMGVDPLNIEQSYSLLKK
ncbi:MAG: TolC family protein [Deltaproteobacteria bacterium]|nr:TolC family protein [Deltaproteobacteria bacterium]